MSHRISVTPLVRILAIALCAVGCDRDPMRPDSSADPPVRFALSESRASAYEVALDDVRDRILPALPADLTPAVASGLDELHHALVSRDQFALQGALNRLNDALTSLDPAAESSVDIAAELDAVRFILEQARPLAGDKTR